MQEMSAAGLSSSLSLTPSDYLLEINKVLLGMADNELLLNSSELSGGLYEDFPSQEDTLKVGDILNITFYFKDVPQMYIL